MIQDDVGGVTRRQTAEGPKSRAKGLQVHGRCPRKAFIQRPESEGGLACCSGNSRETSRTSTHEQRGKGRSTNPRGSKGKSCWILCKQFVRSFAFTLSQKGSHWKVFEQRSDVT